MLGYASPQRIVGESGDAMPGGGARHPIERIPSESVALCILHAFHQVTAFVVAVANACIFLEQIVQQLRQRGAAGNVFLLRGIGRLDVAGRVKREFRRRRAAVPSLYGSVHLPETSGFPPAPASASLRGMVSSAILPALARCTNRSISQTFLSSYLTGVS
jgi:hypothetical protein